MYVKEAGTTKKGFFSLNPSISLSYSTRDGSVDEYSFNSSEIDSKLDKRSFSVISCSMIYKFMCYSCRLSRGKVISNLYIVGLILKHTR